MTSLQIAQAINIVATLYWQLIVSGIEPVDLHEKLNSNLEVRQHGTHASVPFNSEDLASSLASAFEYCIECH